MAKSLRRYRKKITLGYDKDRCLRVTEGPGIYVGDVSCAGSGEETGTASQGVTDHAELNALSLVWNASAHTGTASGIAGFGASGEATYYQFGTTAGSICEGNDSRLSDSRPPNGSAGGVLGGSYPNPSFAVDMATQAELDVVGAIASGAATSISDHIADTSAAHAASAISYAGGTGMSANNVEAAVDELATEKANAADLTAHIDDTSAAHAASAISYAGGTGISAANVEGAIDELATEKADTASAVMDGDAAGGDLSGTYPSPGVVNDSHAHTMSTLTLDYAETTLGGAFDITGASGVYQDTNLTVNLPSAGRYLVFAMVRCTLAISAGTSAFITCKLRNITGGADVSNTIVLTASVSGTGVTDDRVSPIFGEITVAGSSDIRIFAARSNGTTYTSSRVNVALTKIASLKLNS